MRTLIGKFREDRSGAIQMIFAVTLVPVVLTIGAAVDYSRSKQVRDQLQAALDNAVLAGAVEAAKGNGDAVPGIVANYVNANFKTVTATASGTYDRATAKVIGTASAPVATTFMRVLGTSSVTVSVNSQAVYGNGKVEVALALDTTGSMAGTKLSTAQKAASDLVDTLYAMPQASSNVKVALVPFTSYVNVGTAYRNASWISGATDYSTTSTGCWDTYPNATYSDPYTVNATCSADGRSYDCSYTAYRTVNYGTPVNVCGSYTSNYTWYGCVGSRNSPLDLSDTVSNADRVPALLNYGCSQPLIRLTNTAATIKTGINSLYASGETYIAPGLLWAWRTLSPNAPFADGQAYGPGITKSIVLMTDGENTHSANYPDHEGSNVADANNVTAKTCSNIKDAGIRVITIAFMVTDTDIKSILKRCATTDGDFFEATDTTALLSAFKAIGARLTAVRIER